VGGADMEEQNKKMDQENDEKVQGETEEPEVIDTDEAEPEADTDSSSEDDELQILEQEKNDLSDKMIRIQAEFTNYKKRTQKEKEAASKYKSEDLATELLPVIDNFERALQVEETEETASLLEGIKMVYGQLQDALKSQGVEAMETEGAEFDPNMHHAVMQAEDEEQESNIIIEEVQKGYMLKDRVIRPAMVKVNK